MNKVASNRMDEYKSEHVVAPSPLHVLTWGSRLDSRRWAMACNAIHCQTRQGVSQPQELPISAH